MTRRDFIGAAAAAAIPSRAPARLLVPVHRIVDVRAQRPAEQVHHFPSKQFSQLSESALPELPASVYILDSNDNRHSGSVCPFWG
jgi:hypothetical protein